MQIFSFSYFDILRLIFYFCCKGRQNINACLSPSVDADNKSATTEKTKGFSPIGKNPYIKIPQIFR
jgi:hypothetical protein